MLKKKINCAQTISSKHFILVVACLLMVSCNDQPSKIRIVPPSNDQHIKDETHTIKRSGNDKPIVNAHNALKMFLRACQRKPWQRALPKPHAHLSNTLPTAWKEVCKRAEVLIASANSDRKNANHQAELFFRDHFQAYSLGEGLFTGYFAAEVAIQSHQDEKYRYPIHAPPPKNQSPISRDQITQNPEHAPILYYAHDAIDLFLLHIQGSGIGILPNNKAIPLGFAAHNSHQYQSIGRYLIDQGIFTPEELNWPVIEQWLRKQSPLKQQQTLEQNPRYIYFSKTNALPTGSLGVPLIAEAAMAIDPKYVPLGIPLWLDAEGIDSPKPFQRWLISADTGAAIKGKVRGDVYFGFGKRAKQQAGMMKSRGNLVLYLPK